MPAIMKREGAVMVMVAMMLHHTATAQYSKAPGMTPGGQKQRVIDADLHGFLERQFSYAHIRYNNHWLARKEDSDRYIIFTNQASDEPDTCFYFPFRDVKMRYCGIDLGPAYYKKHGSSWVSQFTINGYKLPIDYNDNRTNPVITASTIRRFTYRHSKFITMWGHLAQYSGYGDRIQFNYFFDISRPRATQDIYTNLDGTVEYPHLYGDLNNDTLLDRVVYDGVGYPWCDDTCSVTVKAETYRDHKWQPLRDKNNKPYYIKLVVNGEMDNLRLADYNWMKPLE